MRVGSISAYRGGSHGHIRGIMIAGVIVLVGGSLFGTIMTADSITTMTMTTVTTRAAA